MNLLLEVVGRFGQRGFRGVIVNHGEGSQEHYNAQDSLHGLLPAIADDGGVLRRLGFRNRGLVDLGFGDLGFGHELAGPHQSSPYFSVAYRNASIGARTWSAYLLPCGG